VTVVEPGVGPPAPRKPRKIFLLIGCAVAVALGIGLFTGLGTSPTSNSAPRVGGPVPAFTTSRLNGTGSVTSATGSPTVFLFFGNWCEACHAELPPLAATVRRQRAAHGALSGVQVIGIDNEDDVDRADAFIKSSGVTFPVGYDPNLAITEGDFYFRSDPEAVFVDASGTINRIVIGQTLTPGSFTADERDLIPSGS
jgi:peroxiredoxin